MELICAFLHLKQVLCSNVHIPEWGIIGHGDLDLWTVTSVWVWWVGLMKFGGGRWRDFRVKVKVSIDNDLDL